MALLTLVLYDTYSEAFYFMAPYFLVGKLYVISFLCNLNTRKILTGRGTELQGNTYHKSNNVYMMTTPRDHDYSGGKALETGVAQDVSDTFDLEHTARNTCVVLGHSQNDLKV